MTHHNHSFRWHANLCLLGSVLTFPTVLLVMAGLWPGAMLLSMLATWLIAYNVGWMDGEHDGAMDEQVRQAVVRQKERHPEAFGRADQ